ncbi:MAG: hypothetical protein H6R13_2424, partial [Proteobacteria bacterium]|nr:hypothetical protein [Pseudomonadota bacterium]
VQFVKDQFHPAELDVRQQQRGEIMKQTPHPVKHSKKFYWNAFFIFRTA